MTAPRRIRFWHWLVGCPEAMIVEIGRWGMMFRCEGCHRIHWRV